MNQDQPITLQLTTDEINLILESLGQQPFVKVYALIGKIQNQAAAQLSGKETAAEDTGQS
jgi:hypothetical protein